MILFGEDRDRGLAHLVGGAQDANGDLAPVSHQNSFEAAHMSARLPDRRVRAFYTDVLSCGSDLGGRRRAALHVHLAQHGLCGVDEAGHGVGAEGTDAADAKLSTWASLPG